MPPVPTEQQSNYARRLDGGGSGPAPSAKNASIAHRRQDRGDDGDGDSDGEPGTILRFRDLRRRQIVGNWTTLLAWIAEEGFPPGFMLGQNTRGWFEADVIAWLRSRPVASSTRQRVHADT